MPNIIKSSLDHTYRYIVLDDRLRTRIIAAMHGEFGKQRLRLRGAIPAAACVLAAVLLVFFAPQFIGRKTPGTAPSLAALTWAPAASAEPTPAPTDQARIPAETTPAPTEQARIPLPADPGVKLYGSPPEAQISIKVFPKYLPFAQYYVPDSEAQERIRSFVEEALGSDKLAMDYGLGYSGVSILYKGDVWQLADDCSIYTVYGMDTNGMISERKEPIRIAGQKGLCDFVWRLVDEKLGISRANAADIRDIVRAELSYFPGYGGESYGGESGGSIRQAVTDPEKLKLIEKCFSQAVPQYSDNTNCPYSFPTALLALERSDGEVFWLHLIQDGCPQFFIEGTLYVFANEDSPYATPGEDILRIFDKIPFYCNQNSSKTAK